MTLTATLTLRPHELQPGDILIEHLGQRVGGFDPPSLLLYAGVWHVWSSLDKKICELPADADVEVLRAEPQDVPEDGVGTPCLNLCGVTEPSSGATSDDCPPTGIVRVRNMWLVTP